MSAQLVLTQRDMFIICFIYAFGGVALSHVQARFFPNSRSHSPCSERVGKLVAAGYVNSRRLPPQSGVGSGHAFLTIGQAARPLLSEALGIPMSELARMRTEAPTFIHHHLAICDVRLSFELACESSPAFTLQDWVNDAELHHSPLRVKDPSTDKSIPLIPDGSFTLALQDGTEQNFYLERIWAQWLPRGSERN